MKKRNVAYVIILSIVTLGIYQLFWIKWTRDEMVALGAKMPRFIVLFYPLLAFVAAIVLTIATSGLDSSPTKVAITIASIVISIGGMIGLFALTIWWFYHYCRAVAFVTNGHTSFDMSFILWIVLWFFGFPIMWPGIIQDGFNNVGVAPQQPHQPQPMPYGPPLSSDTPTQQPHAGDPFRSMPEDRPLNQVADDPFRSMPPSNRPAAQPYPGPSAPPQPTQPVPQPPMPRPSSAHQPHQPPSND